MSSLNLSVCLHQFSELAMAALSGVLCAARLRLMDFLRTAIVCTTWLRG